MRQLVERLKSEKTAISHKVLGQHQNEAEGREQAYNAGKAVAKKWINNSSYIEIKDVWRCNETNTFESKRNYFYKSIEKVCPLEIDKFKWFYYDSFMGGWRDGVIAIWNTVKRDVDG